MTIWGETEIKEYLNNYNKWFGQSGAPVGEDTIVKRMYFSGPAEFAFTLVTDMYGMGTWVQVLGATDTPIQAGKIKFDLNKIMIASASSALPYLIQIVSGESADIATKLTSNDYTEVAFLPGNGIIEVVSKKYDVGTKLWMRAGGPGHFGTNLTLYYSLREHTI